MIHTEGAEILATYRDDFYAGMPVLTVNQKGAGQAYYLAARVREEGFYDSLYGRLIREAGVRRALDAELPEGVTAQLRSDGESDYVFLLNFSGKPAQVRLDDRAYTDLETGEVKTGRVELPLHGSIILKRSSQYK
ncbi:Beta-galactosidase BglY [compost metagenome]